MATSRVERWAMDGFDWMADQWGAYQHPGADMPIPRGKRGLNTDYGVPPGIARPPTLGLPSLEDIQIGQPRNRWFGVPERPMTENEFRNRLTLPWNPPASMRQSQMTPEQIEEVMQPQSHMSQMSPQQIAQIQKRQEMLEHFRRVITARRHAAMNP